MTTTNFYQGMASEKSSSRVLQAPGGDSNNIFGHYQAESEREKAERHQRDTQAVIQSVSNAGGANGEITHTYADNKDSFNANRQRNQGEGTPFATNDNLISTGQPRVVQPQALPSDHMSAKEAQAINRSRNQGHGAPFATGDSAPEKHVYPPEMVGNYQPPQQRQASNPNKAGNSFSNLFGDSDADSLHGKSKGKGTFNPITGEDHVENPSTKVMAPPGGKSSLQF
ncbi:uncharacterized protein [Watersipora subatra]|uniref:uncharacterized protein isoform X2 n=1 Tax=Watersipora subatra TaxID=2589382 RepID=UPI00355B01A9